MESEKRPPHVEVNDLDTGRQWRDYALELERRLEYAQKRWNFYQEKCSALSEQLAGSKAPLFKLGGFTLHGGQNSNWKIECDSLTDADWACLAKLISMRVQFSSVSGVPAGGSKLAEALEGYKGEAGPHLVVDDVLTTGQSILEEMQLFGAVTGFVVFARGPLPNGVQALWVDGQRLAEAKERGEAVRKIQGEHDRLATEPPYRTPCGDGMLEGLGYALTALGVKEVKNG